MDAPKEKRQPRTEEYIYIYKCNTGRYSKHPNKKPMAL
jgi:hypothetical protein